MYCSELLTSLIVELIASDFDFSGQLDGLSKVAAEVKFIGKPAILLDDTLARVLPLFLENLFRDASLSFSQTAVLNTPFDKLFPSVKSRQLRSDHDLVVNIGKRRTKYAADESIAELVGV